MLPHWLREDNPKTSATSLSHPFDSWLFHSRKQAIASPEASLAPLSVIAQYVVGSLAFGAMMMWSMENFTHDANTTTVLEELIPYVKRGGVWPDKQGRPVLLHIDELTDTAIRWFYTAHARQSLDPVVKALLRKSVAMPLIGLGQTTRYTVVSDTAIKPAASLQQLCVFFEQVTPPGSLEDAQIFLPTTGWLLDNLPECPPIIAMMQSLYDTVHITMETSTRQIRWIFADHSRFHHAGLRL